MPIRQSQKGLYPDNWKEIRAQILLRSVENGIAVCEKCKRPNTLTVFVFSGSANVPNGSWFIPDESGDCTITKPDGESFFIDIDDIEPVDEDEQIGKWVKTVLTIAHLDQDPTNNHFDNLKALCQRCHNIHDAYARTLHRKLRNEWKAIQAGESMCTLKELCEVYGTHRINIALRGEPGYEQG